MRTNTTDSRSHGAFQKRCSLTKSWICLTVRMTNPKRQSLVDVHRLFCQPASNLRRTRVAFQELELPRAAEPEASAVEKIVDRLVPKTG